MIKGNWYTDGVNEYRFYSKRPDGLCVFDGYKGNGIFRHKFLIGYPSMDPDLKPV